MTIVDLQKRENQSDDEKVSGTKTSTKKTNRLLAIGGPAEGKLLEDYGYSDMQYAEIKPVAWKMWQDDVIDDPQDLGYIKHIYRKHKLAFQPDQYESPHLKEIYLHSSLTIATGIERLKAFLLEQFIMMELE